MDSRLKICLLASLLFRFLSACWQNAYIHPDEYFQSLEVLAGDIFDFRSRIPWEFNTSQPVRSISSCGLFVGLPLVLYRGLCSQFGLQVNLYVVLLLPRLINALASLLLDVCLLKLSASFKLHPEQGLFILWTSFLPYVHVLRPLSNAWETFFFCGLLLLTVSGSGLRCAVGQGCVLALGSFCRPTFALFAFVPVMEQLRRNYLGQAFSKTLRFYLTLLAAFTAAACGAVVCDSLYFGNRLVVTPFNFLAYNWRAENLQSHGAHPWFTHLLVNLPQLFGPAVLLFFLSRSSGQSEDRMRHLLLAFLFPTVCLSLFCHQEMRFLLPLLPLACLLVSSALQRLQDRPGLRKLFFSAWAAFNFLSFLFWGFFHQAGVVPALHHLRDHRSLHPDRCQVSFFFKTYMPPEFLLARHRSEGDCVVVRDLGSFPPSKLRKFVMDDIANFTGERKVNSFIIFPSSVHKEVLTIGLPIRLPACVIFPFHVTTEHLPDVFAILNLNLAEALYAVINAFSLIACPVDPKMMPQF